MKKGLLELDEFSLGPSVVCSSSTATQKEETNPPVEAEVRRWRGAVAAVAALAKLRAEAAGTRRDDCMLFTGKEGRED